MSNRPRLLSGITPTGKMHLGHWVGAIENWVTLQSDFDCFYLLANKHAFTTRANRPAEIRASVMDLATDLLACGIDPSRSALFIQSEVPCIDELTFFLSMLLPFNRVMRNPTLAEEIRDKGLGDHYPFGFPLYAVGQCADILAFRPDVVPVGEDQVPHLELCREVTRKFNVTYCGVDSHARDDDHARLGGVFPVIRPRIGRVKRLVGLGAPSAETGQLLKMSKSLNNAIYFDDEPVEIEKKIRGMYTDPKRLRATDPGETDASKNPLWAMHEAFNSDVAWVESHKAQYAAGQVGDVVIKKKLIEVIETLVGPIRERRRHYAARPDDVLDALKLGTKRANAVAEETLTLAKAAMKQDYFSRVVDLR
jgi:tryptophanyl-tRNA synthetase